MTALELTDELIATAMAKADRRVCVGSDRCFASPDRIDDACETCTPKKIDNSCDVPRIGGNRNN